MAEVIRAGEPATDGEVRAAERLAHLPDDWLVVCNKMVVVDADRSFEVDFIIVGQRHLFVVDEKWYDHS